MERTDQQSHQLYGKPYHGRIDIALEYGYDSPDSFTKAFLRFHGATPTAIRKGEAMIKSFAPMKIKLILTGGYTMD